MQLGNYAKLFQLQAMKLKIVSTAEFLAGSYHNKSARGLLPVAMEIMDICESLALSPIP